MKLNLSGHDNPELNALGFVNPGALHVDLADPELANKVTEFLKAIPGMNGTEQVTVALPGLAALATLVVTIIHGLTGSFPIIQPLIREQNGFVPGPLMDLQSLRNDIARTSRSNVVVL